MNYIEKSNIYLTVEKKCAKTRESVLVVLGLMLVSIMIFFSIILSPRIVSGSSMYPTLNSKSSGDIVYIFKQRTYRRGDIVVLEKNETQSHSDVIKRVIGVAGDRIEVKLDKDNYYKIFINDKVAIKIL